MRSRIIKFEDLGVTFLETFDPVSGEYEYYIKEFRRNEFVFSFGTMQRFYKRDLNRLLREEYFDSIWEEL